MHRLTIFLCLGVLMLTTQIHSAEKHDEGTLLRDISDDSQITINTSGFSLPEYKGHTRDEVERIALNFFFNQLSEHPELCLVDPSSQSGGVARITHFVGADSGKKINLSDCVIPDFVKKFSQGYPFACEGIKKTTPKTFRLDWLVHELMERYNELDNVPKNRSELRDKYGVEIEYQKSPDPKAVIEESFVARKRRAIGALKRDNGSFAGLITWDSDADATKGTKYSFALHPTDTQMDAAEIFLQKPNGLRKYLLHDFNGDKRLVVAAAGVADFVAGLAPSPVHTDAISIKAHGKSNGVRNSIDCLICHTSGTLSETSSNSNKEIINEAKAAGVFRDPKIEALARKMYDVPEGKEDDESYVPAKEVSDLVSAENNTYNAALKKMGVKDADAPILPDIHANFSENPSLFRAAEELGSVKEDFVALLKELPTLAQSLGIRKMDKPDKVTIDRELFNERFCEIAFLLEQAKDPFVKRTLRLLEAQASIERPEIKAELDKAIAAEKEKRGGIGLLATYHAIAKKLDIDTEHGTIGLAAIGEKIRTKLGIPPQERLGLVDIADRVVEREVEQQFSERLKETFDKGAQAGIVANLDSAEAFLKRHIPDFTANQNATLSDRFLAAEREFETLK